MLLLLCYLCQPTNTPCRPDALDGALLQQLPVQLGLDVPSAEAREDLLMGWLMEREAAVNVQDVEVLARCGCVGRVWDGCGGVGLCWQRGDKDGV